MKFTAIKFFSRCYYYFPYFPVCSFPDFRDPVCTRLSLCTTSIFFNLYLCYLAVYCELLSIGTILLLILLCSVKVIFSSFIVHYNMFYIPLSVDFFFVFTPFLKLFLRGCNLKLTSGNDRGWNFTPTRKNYWARRDSKIGAVNI